jgi:hypothetical protein
VRALTRHPQLLGNVGDRAPITKDALDYQGTSELIETRTRTSSVKQENLLAREISTSPLSQEVLPLHKTQTVTHVTAEYI